MLKNNNFFESFLGFNNAPRKKQFITKPFDPYKFIYELAYHEASHFVFNCMANQLDLEFRFVTEMKILSSDGTGATSGFEPDISGNTYKYIDRDKNYMRHSINLENFYQSNPIRIIVRIFTLVAGYASYQVFIKNSTFFINKVFSERIEYHSIENFKLPKTLPNRGEHDLVKVEQFLRLLSNHECRVNWQIDCQPFFDEVKKLMRMKLVNEAIRFVKNYLIKNDGKIITGDELIHITRIVNNITNKVSFEKSVNKFLS